MDCTELARQRYYQDHYAVTTSNIKIDYAEPNYARCSMEIDDRHMNTNGSVMGGAIFTLADYAFGVAANIADAPTLSLSATINFMRGTKGPVLFAEAKCVKNGRSICFYEVSVTDSEGKLVASVQSNGFVTQKTAM